VLGQGGFGGFDGVQHRVEGYQRAVEGSSFRVERWREGREGDRFLGWAAGGRTEKEGFLREASFSVLLGSGVSFQIPFFADLPMNRPLPEPGPGRRGLAS
jgi:hypothetical protein